MNAFTKIFKQSANAQLDQLNRDLFLALLKGDEAAVDKSIEQGADILGKVVPDKRSYYGSDPRNSISSDFIPALIAFPHFLSEDDMRFGKQPTVEQERQMIYSAIDLALKKGADINGRTHYWNQTTALIMATSHDDEKLVDLLLSKGANTALQDNRGYTAESYARYQNNPTLIEKFSNAAFEQSLSDKPAAEAQQLRERFKQEKAEKAAKQEQDKKDSALRQACYSNQPEKVTQLLAEGANAYAVNGNGQNAGTAAANEGSRQALKALFDAGVDLTREDSHGKSAATHRSSAEFVTNLISQKRTADELKELREEVTRLNKALGFKNGTKRIPKREETLAAKRAKR